MTHGQRVFCVVFIGIVQIVFLVLGLLFLLNQFYIGFFYVAALPYLTYAQIKLART